MWVTLTGSQSTGQASAAELQSATSPRIEHNILVASELASNAPSDLVVVRCAVKHVGVNYRNNTVGIHSTNCTPSTGAILYFSVVGTDSKQANQVLSIGLAAIATGKLVGITYDPNDTNVPDPGDNRKILSVGLDQ